MTNASGCETGIKPIQESPKYQLKAMLPVKTTATSITR